MPTKKNYQGNQQNYDPKDGEYERGPAGAFSSFRKPTENESSSNVNELQVSRDGNKTLKEWFSKNSHQLQGDKENKDYVIEAMLDEFPELNKKDALSYYDANYETKGHDVATLGSSNAPKEDTSNDKNKFGSPDAKIEADKKARGETTEYGSSVRAMVGIRMASDKSPENMKKIVSELDEYENETVIDLAKSIKEKDEKHITGYKERLASINEERNKLLQELKGEQPKQEKGLEEANKDYARVDDILSNTQDIYENLPEIEMGESDKNKRIHKQAIESLKSRVPDITEDEIIEALKGSASGNSEEAINVAHSLFGKKEDTIENDIKNNIGNHFKDYDTSSPDYLDELENDYAQFKKDKPNYVGSKGIAEEYERRISEAKQSKENSRDITDEIVAKTLDKYNGNEDKALEELRKGNYDISNGDLQGMVEVQTMIRNSKVNNAETPKKKLNFKEDLAERVSKNPDYKKVSDIAKVDDGLKELVFYAVKDAYEQNGGKPTEKNIRDLAKQYYNRELEGFIDSEGYDKESGTKKFLEEYGTNIHDFVKETVQAHNKLYGSVNKKDLMLGDTISKNADQLKQVRKQLWGLDTDMFKTGNYGSKEVDRMNELRNKYNELLGTKLFSGNSSYDRGVQMALNEYSEFPVDITDEYYKDYKDEFLDKLEIGKIEAQQEMNRARRIGETPIVDLNKGYLKAAKILENYLKR